VLGLSVVLACNHYTSGFGMRGPTPYGSKNAVFQQPVRVLG
jgi:hypothetical protein